MDENRKPYNYSLYFGAAVVLLMIFATISIYFLNKSFTESEIIEERRRIHVEIDGIVTALHMMESAQRGFIITQDSALWSNYPEGSAKLDRHIQGSKSLIQADSINHILDSIQGMALTRLQLLNHVDSIYNSKGMITRPLQEKLIEGDVAMDEMRALAKAVLQNQESIRQKQIQQIEEQRYYVFASLAVFTLIAVIIIISGFWKLKLDQASLIAAARENKMLADSISEREERYRSLNDSSNDAIIITDVRGQILSWNAAATSIFGFEEAEALGQPLDIIIPEKYGKRHHQAIARLLETDHPKMMGKRVEMRGLKKDGTEFPIELTLSQWIARGERYFSGNIRDITKDKMLRKKLDNTLSELKRSNQELEQFAYVASHDLQEPLRKIRAFSDRMMTKIESPKENKQSLIDYAQRMSLAAERMQNLIQDLLSFSRVTRNQGERSNVDLNIMMNEILEDLEYYVKERQGQVIVRKLPVLKDVSRTQMHQLFQNLISNGIKFRKEDTDPVVIIKHKVVDASSIDEEDFETIHSNYHEFVIKDNGIGFDEKYLDKVFTIFQRLHDRSTFSGSGIGLAMCKRICENHGGVLTAKSKPGQGSKFFIYLPAKVK